MGYDRHGRRPPDFRASGHPARFGDIEAEEYRRFNFTVSTAASTAFSARGFAALVSTSTANGAQHLYTLTDPSSGVELQFVVDAAAASSFTFKFNTSANVTFGTLPATTSLTQIQLPGVVGSAVHLLGKSTSRWYVGPSVNATLSSATG